MEAEETGRFPKPLMSAHDSLCIDRYNLDDHCVFKIALFYVDTKRTFSILRSGEEGVEQSKVRIELSNGLV